MHIRINLLAGTLKIKDYRHLRQSERDGKVSVRKIGPVYFVWAPNRRGEVS